MPNFDPIHYAAVALGVFLLIVSGMYWKQSQDLKVCTAEYAGFVANTKAAGTTSELERTIKENSLANAAVKIQGDLNAQYIANAKLHADNKRLLNDRASAGASQAGALASSSGRFNCTDRESELAGALERLEIGILPILESRDKAIIRTEACKVYLEEVQSILNASEGQSSVFSPKQPTESK